MATINEELREIQETNARNHGYTRARKEFWKKDGRIVRCANCDDEIGGRLLLREVLGVAEPICLECGIETLVCEYGHIDCGAEGPR